MVSLRVNFEQIYIFKKSILPCSHGVKLSSGGKNIGFITMRLEYTTNLIYY